MIRKRSKKRAKQEREYFNKTRPEYLEDHPGCEANIPRICCCTSVEIHHKKGKIEDLLNDKRFFLAVCRRCHDYIEAHPAWAKEMGYSLSRLAKDSVSPN